MAAKTPLRKLELHGHKTCCDIPYPRTSMTVMSCSLIVFLLCFFFIDMELIYQKTGLEKEAPVILQKVISVVSTANRGSEDNPRFRMKPSSEVNTENVMEDVSKVSTVNKDKIENPDPVKTMDSDANEVVDTREVANTEVKMEGIEVDVRPQDQVGGADEFLKDVNEFAAVDALEPSKFLNGVEFQVEPQSAKTIIPSVSPLSVKVIRDKNTPETQKSPTPSDSISEKVMQIPTHKLTQNNRKSLAKCDITQGRWVFDNETYPLYRTKKCPFADPGFRCEDNGRPDKDFMSYRWQPHDCDLPRFNATDILERIRGQRMVFVGDSLGRNNWESMLCMLAEAVSNKSRIYEIYNQPISKHSGSLVFKFMDYNCTVEYYRDPFLIPQTRPPRSAPRNVTCALRVDHVSNSIGKWKNADIVIFNAGHWWTEHKIFHQGCKFQEGDSVRNYDLHTGLQKALRTWTNWLEDHIDPEKTQVLWLSFPTVHFRGGTWNRGGHCHQEKRPLTEEEARAEWQTPWMNQFVQERITNGIKKKKDSVTYLDITTQTNYRPDAHGALYTWDTKKYGLKPRNRQDCSHFCLPGVPDAWNELILATLLAKGKGSWGQPVRL